MPPATDERDVHWTPRSCLAASAPALLSERQTIVWQRRLLAPDPQGMIDTIRRIRRRRYLKHLVARGLTLGEHVFLNDGFFLDPAHCHLITIDDDVTFGPGVRILAHDASSLKVVGKTRVGLVHVERNCFLGAGATILPGVTVGENSIIGAGSVVTRSVPPAEVWAGVPARRLFSVAELRDRLTQLPQHDFPLARYGADVLTAERRSEMRLALAEFGAAFMTGRVRPRAAGQVKALPIVAAPGPR